MRALLSAVAQLGQFLSDALHGAGYSLFLLFHTLLHLPAVFERQCRSAVWRQMFICGIQTIPVTMVVSIFTGMILALNGGLSLQSLGQESLIGRIVAVSMTREMGPFMTALILAASVGSGIAAEIGTMKVSEEVDALEVMSIDPARFLVLPRLIAMALMTPVLTIYINFVGTLGGAVASYFQYDVSFTLFKNDALAHLAEKDIYTGVLKAFIFGVVISIVACGQGLRAYGGAIGVGRATRMTVVVSYLLIIILGYYVTFIFYYLRW
jgi:phospholipid/cholesterol/gamma-HCH transport system permease protein